MKVKNMAFSAVLSLLLGALSLNALSASFNFNNLKGRLTDDPGDRFKVVDDHLNLSFLPQRKPILNLDLMMVSKKFNKSSLQRSRYRHYDMGGLMRGMSHDDMVLVSRSAVLYPNMPADYFKAQRVLTRKFSKVYFGYKKLKTIGRDSMTYTKKFGIADEIDVTTHVSHYILETGEKFNMTSDQTKLMLSNAPLGNKNLGMITSTYSTERDIEKASRGGRTVNYYYHVGPHTLKMSLKMVTFKRADLNSFEWGIVEKVAVKKQKSNSKKSLERFRDYYYED